MFLLWGTSKWNDPAKLTNNRQQLVASAIESVSEKLTHIKNADERYTLAASIVQNVLSNKQLKTQSALTRNFLLRAAGNIMTGQNALFERQKQQLIDKQNQKKNAVTLESYDTCVRRLMNNGEIDSVALVKCQKDPNVDPTTKSGIGWTTANGVTKHASVANKLLTLQNHYNGTIDKVPSPIKNAASNTGMEAVLKTRTALRLEPLDMIAEPKQNSIRSAAIEDNRPHFIRTMDHTQERRRNW